ncbi:hypothetical protein M409DRAFT_22293 [Zasmidium cellare ATCC 36951]|uniref:MYND-type domain-containing protein n=1 Tax=Zasmidium cellare ATCC 36951 TaxID=1080233 RepID=A0A6A6CK02_ZASCE|nr:uncharacterized protein M409DRAFT_22293 [Zasmidium cellare ATCC 36951]KAF2167485.1 hypothetical protein M409DRAFT_22293 [Zasmidium cellare ATCC 36951]
MGGWQLKLFCCDLDLDLVQELNGDCGLYDLEVRHGRKGLKPGTGTLRQDEHRLWAAKSKAIKEEDVMPRPELPKQDEENETPISYSLFEKLCSHTDRVRAHLDTTGALEKQFEKLHHEANTSNPNWTRDPYGPGYRLCILGACGMTLGAKISTRHKNVMRKYYKDCGLMRDAMTQIEAALDPATGYKDGTPHDFGSPSQQENMANGGAPKEDLIYPGCGMANVWVPDHSRKKSEMKLAHENVMMGIAYHQPNVEDLAQTLASLFFDPSANARTAISSTKADSKPQDFMETARELIKDYKPLRPARKHDDGEPFDPEEVTSTKEKCRGCRAETTKAGKPLLSCGKCKIAKYCSMACQRKDWKEHKQMCGISDLLELVKKLGTDGVVSSMKPT